MSFEKPGSRCFVCHVAIMPGDEGEFAVSSEGTVFTVCDVTCVQMLANGLVRDRAAQGHPKTRYWMPEDSGLLSKPVWSAVWNPEVGFTPFKDKPKP